MNPRRGHRSRSRSRRPAARRRGVVIVAVIIVTGTVLLIASGMIPRAASDRGILAGESRRVQQRVAAWSGVRAMMSELAADRAAILDGRSPMPPAEESILWAAGGDEWIVRLLPLGADGAVVVAEAGKLDLGAATADELLATGVLDPAAVDAIIAARDGRPGGRLAAVAELAALGVDPTAVLGPLEEIRTSSAGAGVEQDLAERVLDRLGAGRIEAAADLLTVHAVEPAIQRDGTRRIVLPETWSDELGRRLDARFGDGASAAIRQLIEGGVRFDRTEVIVQQLVAFGVEPDEWGPFLDALTADPADEHLGRLDLNTASVAALRTLPGIEEATAQAIADERDGLSAEERWTIAWPVMRGIVAPEDFGAMADRLTTRSFTWRMRIAVGRRSSTGEADEPLRDVTVLEAVVDLAAPQPRLAELRDVTHLELAAQLVLAAGDAWMGDEVLAGDAGASDPGRTGGSQPDAGGGPGEGSPSFDDPFGGSPMPEPTVGFGQGGGGLVDPPSADPASGGGDGPMEEGPPMSPAGMRPGAGEGDEAAAPNGGGESGPGAPIRRRGARWLGPGG